MMSYQKSTRTVLFAGLAVAAGVSFAAPAQANPVDQYVTSGAGEAVCSTLDIYPTFDGIEGVGAGIVKDTGWTLERAGAVIQESIWLDCPRHTGLWNRFVATYGPGTTAPGAGGYRGGEMA